MKKEKDEGEEKDKADLIVQAVSRGSHGAAVCLRNCPLLRRRKEWHIFVLYFVICFLYFVFRFVFEEATASRRRGSLSPLGGMPLRRTHTGSKHGRRDGHPTRRSSLV